MAFEQWIGVDLDGTLAMYASDPSWDYDKELPPIGPPIVPMLTRVKQWLSEGKTVKILTARASHKNKKEVQKVKDWCRQYVGQELDVTATKSPQFVEIWDDRAVQVIPNTGMRADGSGDISSVEHYL